MTNRARWPGAIALLVLPLALLAACSSSPSPSASATASAATGSGIGKMLVSGSGSPYFSDPYPVYRSSHSTSAADPHIVFGTPDAELLCPGQIRPGCYRRKPVAITISPAIRKQAKADGTSIVATQNHNPYENAKGQWTMALTVSVTDRSDSSSGHWSVVLHAHPEGSSSPAPTTWVADSVLAGSLANRDYADYDGKYYESDGTLYLLYSRRLSDKPARDGVVAQRMSSPEKPDGSAPVVLLQPDAGAGFTSEDFFANAPDSSFKLVETGNIAQIDGKYVMAYSTGAYDENDYKTGIAWSSTFLPSAGSTYAKLVIPDPANIWHNPGHQDVDYLMQSQRPYWPHYTGGQVLAPGVPAIVQAGGDWSLIFAGYQPSGGQPPSHFDPANRQPYLVPLCPSGSASILTTCTRLPDRKGEKRLSVRDN